MIFRNSILSIIRSKGKTALFTLLIFALTLVLALGISVWASVAQFLEDCDDYYTTIGLVEYMGTGYPNDTAYDDAMAKALVSFEPSVIVKDDSVFTWETPARALGYVDGFWRTDTLMPNRMYSVLVIGNASFDARDKIYSAIVMKSIYSLKSKDDTIIYIDGNFGEFEPDRYYLVFGEVYYGRSPLLHLRAATYENAVAEANGLDIPRMIDITADGDDGKFFTIPEDSSIMQVARTLPVTNNSVLVSGTDNLMALLPFHQQELYIVDGRAFTQEEYDQGSQVAVVSDLLAARLGVGIGDTINLSAAISDQPGVYNSYWVADGFAFQAPFTIVGIMNTVMDKSWYVYVPKSSGIPWSEFPIGYTVGQAVINNENAPEFYSRMAPYINGRFLLTIYDQGYSTVAIPYQTILRIARIVTGVCTLVELALIVLFGFLFVYRQRDTSETMLMLGAGKVRVCGYFLFSSGFISLVAAIAGAAAGYWLHDGIISLVIRAADRYQLIDSRFSNGSLTTSRLLEFAPDLHWRLFLAVGAAVFLFACLSCLTFTLGTFLHSRPSEKRPWGPKKEHRTSHIGGSSMKYAVLSILRGGARTTVVPVLAIAVVIFFGQLVSTTLRYQEQLDSIYENTTITGYYTDIHGKQIGNLVLDAYDAANLYHSGQISSLSTSLGEPYYYLGISKLADGTSLHLEPLFVPTSNFALESLEEEIRRCPNLTATNDIRTTPEFYYSSAIDMTFLTGYDESILTVPTSDPRVFSCILPTSLMDTHNIVLGDSIRVAFDRIYTNPAYDQRLFRDVELLVVGSYEKQGAEDTIYAPLSLLFNSDLIWDEGQETRSAPSQTFDSGYTISPKQENKLHKFIFNSASFILKDTRSLIDTKDYFTDYGYSEVNSVSSVRQFIVLKDASFNNVVASIKQQIRYINTLYPCLYVLVGIISIVVSYLLVVSRKKEFATMRGLGTTRSRAFFSFFWEQSILCVLGTMLGLAGWRLIIGMPAALHLALTGGFLICYFIGCAVSIMIMNHTNVLTILLDRD